jgi:hypothetical protein
MFTLACRILKEQIRMAAGQNRDSIAMEAYFTFLSDHSEHQSYHRDRYLQAFARLGGDTLVHFCSFNEGRPVPAGLCCLARVFRTLGQGDEVGRFCGPC